VAVLRPSLSQLDQLVTPLNAGERRVAECLSTLDDRWTVYIQPRLAHDIPDFVAVHPQHGVCVIEVKDWSYGSWRMTPGKALEYVTGDGVWHTSDERPRFQADRYRSAIYNEYFALPTDGHRPTQRVRAAVVLPQYDTARARALLAMAQVHDEELLVPVWGGDQLKRSIETIVRGKGCAAPHPESLERLHRLLVPSEVTNARLAVALSPDARNIAANPRGAQRRRVRGPAGGGKSFGLAARAAHLASQRKRVLVVSFNTTLRNYLTHLVRVHCADRGANPVLVTCTTFHGLCKRIVDDAAIAGVSTTPAPGLDWSHAIAKQADDAFRAGYTVEPYDAVLVDEGQDFTLEWWQFLRGRLTHNASEMLLVADPTQHIYEDVTPWTDEAHMEGTGFAGPWTTLQGSYRMPPDLVPIANAFSERYLDGERLYGEPNRRAQLDLFGESVATVRHWQNELGTPSIGSLVGHEVVRLIATHRIAYGDLAFVCERHEDGLDAVDVIKAAGIPVNHLFARSSFEKHRRKLRFWPDAPGVKGATIHSFKGWEATALVMGIRHKPESLRLAYVAMTRLRMRSDLKPAYISVVNANPAILGFQSLFEDWQPPSISMWSAPRAEERVG
jgi:hypothetical protein